MPPKNSKRRCVKTRAQRTADNAAIISALRQRRSSTSVESSEAIPTAAALVPVQPPPPHPPVAEPAALDDLEIEGPPIHPHSLPPVHLGSQSNYSPAPDAVTSDSTIDSTAGTMVRNSTTGTMVRSIRCTSGGDKGDDYRCYLHGEEEKNTRWRYGLPPNYNVVNGLFREGRTKIWPPGSLEERVQNLVKTWEMELSHKTDPDYKSIDPNNYTVSLNGRKSISLAEKRKHGGGCTSLLQTSLPNLAFINAFPSGFAFEILHVYSGPPEIVFKFRHWGYMEGSVPFKGHAPTGEFVELFGMAVFQLDESEKVVSVEFFFDRGELLDGLLKGASLDSSSEEVPPTCPYLGNTG